jgi:hypothetical protein
MNEQQRRPEPPVPSLPKLIGCGLVVVIIAFLSAGLIVQLHRPWGLP